MNGGPNSASQPPWQTAEARSIRDRASLRGGSVVSHAVSFLNFLGSTPQAFSASCTSAYGSRS